MNIIRLSFMGTVLLFTVSVAHARVVIRPVDGMTDAQVDALLGRANSHRLHKTKTGLHVVEANGGLSDDQLAAKLKAMTGIRIAEVDKKVFAVGTSTPNDPMLSQEWHITKIGANTAWPTSTGANVVVAILDSGVSPVADLSGHMVTGTNIVSSGASTSDTVGHGTAVAGTMGAICGNGAGVAGVACDAKIMPVVIGQPDGNGGAFAYYSDIATGIRWAADNGAKVINCSYGGLNGSSTISDAASYARSKNVSTVVSAGNNGVSETYANDANLFTVSATDSNDALASWSSYGPAVDIAAPGVSIYTTNMDGSYGPWNGTSFSSPVVAGVEALLLSVNGSLTPAQRESAMTSTAVNVGSSTYFGAGRVNAAAAVKSVAGSSPTPSPSPSPAPAPSPSPSPAPAPAPAPSPSPTPTGDATAPTISMNSPFNGSYVGPTTVVSGNTSDNVGVTKITLSADGKLLATSTGSGFTSYSWNWSGYATGTHTVTVTAYDAAGNHRAVSATVTRLF